MRKESLQHLAHCLTVKDFILVYLEQKEEYCKNKRLKSCIVTQDELKPYLSNMNAARVDLYRLQQEGWIERVGRKAWKKTSQT